MKMIDRRRVLAPRSTYWAYGEITALARESGVSERAIFMIIHRSRRASYNIAVKLVRATKTMDRPIDLNTWLNNLNTDHPAFRAKTEYDPPAKVRPDHMHMKADNNADGPSYRDPVIDGYPPIPDFISVNIDKTSEGADVATTTV